MIYCNNVKSTNPYISKIQIHTSLRNNIHLFGEELKISFTIQCANPINGACLSFQIINIENRPINHQWIFDAEMPFGREAGQHILTCIIPKSKLYMGNYYIKVYFSEPPGGSFFETVEYACPFQVEMLNNPRLFKYQEGACAYIEDYYWIINNSRTFS